MTNEERFSMIAMEMFNIYVKKNADYGNSFDRSLDDDGLLVSKIRLGDKYNRFAQLIGGEQQVSDESKRDTLLDMANYAIMTIMWMDSCGAEDIPADMMIGDSPQADVDGNGKMDKPVDRCDGNSTPGNKLTSIYDGKPLGSVKLNADNTLTSKIEGIFEGVDTEGTNGGEIMHNLQDQINEFKEWESEIRLLFSRDIYNGLFDELRAMGPKALNEVQALNRLSDSELKIYNDLYLSKVATELTIRYPDGCGYSRPLTPREIDHIMSKPKQQKHSMDSWYGSEALKGMDIDGEPAHIKLSNLSYSLEEIREWSDGLKNLRKNGLSTKLYEYLHNLGPVASGISQMRVLDTLSYEGLKQYCLMFDSLV